ncbi:MAG: hypothetical protein RR444_11785 [Oscillospiraceae bacterium]
MKNNVFILSIVGIVAVFAVLFCFSCQPKQKKVSEKEVATSLKKPFDAKATIKMKDLVLVADINKTAVGCATIKISEPKSLKDMNFEYDGKDIKIGYKGLSVKLDENSKLVSSLVAIIVNSIDKAASESGVDVKVDGKVLVVSGESDSGKFAITIDRENGSIATINLPELDFECHFDDFLVKE